MVVASTVKVPHMTTHLPIMGGDGGVNKGRRGGGVKGDKVTCVGVLGCWGVGVWRGGGTGTGVVCPSIPRDPHLPRKETAHLGSSKQEGG